MRIDIVIADDWEGLYVNSKLTDEGHKIKRLELIRVMKEFDTFNVEERWLSNEGIEFIEEWGNFPNRYDDIAQYIEE